MAAPTGHATGRPALRLSPSSILRAVAMFGATLVALAVVGASGRVIGWILAAAALAALFHPVVETLDRWVPRGLALAIVLLGSMAIVGGIGYAVVDEVAVQVGELEQALPRAAREVEESERFGEVARELRVAERAQDFVDELPERLRGGSVNEALRSAATRGVAFLATAVLTIFFLIHGPRLVRSAIAQVPAGDRRDRIWAGAASAYRRSWSYVSGSLLLAVMAGAVAYTAAVLLELPGKAGLALWVALWDLVPLVGLVVGAIPLVLLAATTASWQGSVGVTVVLVAWQLLEGLRLQRDVERRSLHLGPFVTVVVAFLGLELYGIGGVFVSLVAVVVAAAVLDETLGHGPRSAATARLAARLAERPSVGSEAVPVPEAVPAPPPPAPS